MTDGTPLASYIRYDPTLSQFTIIDDGTIVIGSFSFVLTGNIGTPSVSDSMMIKVNVQAGSSN